MSYNEKCDSITKEDWMRKLEQFPYKQSDMNRLIMNYLVTGICLKIIFFIRTCYIL